MDVLNPRSAEILRHVVEAYMEMGEPVGSKTLSKRLGLSLSPATIRSVMASLEDAGLLFSPHTSAGRLPTPIGLRLFVNAFLECGTVEPQEREKLEESCQLHGKNLSRLLEETVHTLSGLACCAGLVLAPKSLAPLRHMEFVYLNPGRALLVLVTQEGLVENRVIDIALEIHPSALKEASNYLNQRLVGHSLADARAMIEEELSNGRAQLDALAQSVVEKGLAVWASDQDSLKGGNLIVRGQSNLLKEVSAIENMKRIHALIEALEAQEELLALLDAGMKADGVQIFIGSENSLFEDSGCSLIMAPYENKDGRLVGVVGVIGPQRMNYGRLIPMVDYTARLVGRLFQEERFP